MTEPQTDITETPKPKPKRRARAKSAPRESRPPEFDGLDIGTCCDACQGGRCYITGDGNCAHPMTSPLQPYYFNKTEIMARFQRAKKFLAHKKLDRLIEGQ